MAEIMKVMDAAKEIMRQSGNMHQWGEGYPSEAVITADIERNGGFVIEDSCMVVAYFAFLLVIPMLMVSLAVSWTTVSRMIQTSALIPIVTIKSCSIT